MLVLQFVFLFLNNIDQALMRIAGKTFCPLLVCIFLQILYILNVILMFDWITIEKTQLKLQEYIMKVNLISTYRPSKANNASNAMSQAYTSPAFTGSEIPRKSMLGGLKTLLLGGALFSVSACSSGNNDAKLAIDAGIADTAIPAAIDTAAISAIDTAVPAAIDTAAISAIDTNAERTVADILLDMYKAAGILPQSAKKLPKVMKYDSPVNVSLMGGVSNTTKGSDILHFVETLDTSNNNPAKVVYNLIVTDSSGEEVPFKMIYRGNSDATLNKSLYYNEDGIKEIIAKYPNIYEVDDLKMYSCKMIQRNGLIDLSDFYYPDHSGSETAEEVEQLMSDAGVKVRDAGGIKMDINYNMQRVAPGTVQVNVYQNGKMVTSGQQTNWFNDGVLAKRIKAGVNRLAGQLDGVQHDLRPIELGGLSLPTGNGTMALIKDLAQKGFKQI